MATDNALAPCADETQSQDETLRQRFVDWARTELVWYAGSFAFHLVALSALLLLPAMHESDNAGDAPTFIANNDEADKPEPEAFERVPPADLGELDKDPIKDLVIDPTIKPPAPQDHDELPSGGQVAKNDSSGTPDGVLKAMLKPGGAMGIGPGPNVKIGDENGLGRSGVGHGTRPGEGGPGLNDVRTRKWNSERTGPSERAVNAALVWLANHQLSEGNWSLEGYTQRCHDKTCTGVGEISADAGATAMGLLPFLAAAQTHKSRGPYREHIRRGLEWLIKHQQPDGNLAKGSTQMMYSHGLATIALCEAYGMTSDRDVGRAAQAAVNFILAAQNKADGGWRYNPGEPGDTSVVGWQVMALKSAHMAGLEVGGSVFSAANKWLDSVSFRDGAQYAYQPGQGPAATMTSVGLLCRQYLGAKRDNPMLTGGMQYLLGHLPDEGSSNIYYWYYATQVMHNMYGSEWDTWNHKIRELLVRTQIRDTDQCANGSWAPEKDAWGRRGGRLMQTSLSTLTLEVYYRYMPLFKNEEVQ